jgi:hypothetical protein
MTRFAVTLLLLLAMSGALSAADRRPASRVDAVFADSAPHTTNNDDTCDIAVMPAATLLLPYFEVSLTESLSTAKTTIFTLTNVTKLPQIAHITIWTDYAFPVIDFNVFLTGYDVQSINLYDIFVRGVIAPSSGTSNETEEGAWSAQNDANPNFLPSASQNCSQLPGYIPASLVEEMQRALTTGRYFSCGSARVGGDHVMATGYVTIDVVADCTTTLPTAETYYSREILFDNALTGDVIQVDSGGNFAGGSPMVHIRAIPEGGAAGVLMPTRLPYTFYDRYTPATARASDRRQPLPSVFAARFIEAAYTSFDTSFKFWREGRASGTAACAAYASNAELPIMESVRFDEHENPTVLSTDLADPPIFRPSRTAASGRYLSSDFLFPRLISPTGDVAGWMYLNLNHGGAASFSSQRPGFSGGTTDAPFVRQSQNWVTISMAAEGRYAVDFDATILGNGCSPSASMASDSVSIGPAPNANP